MEILNRAIVRSDKLGPTSTFSPEYWISLCVTREAAKAGAGDGSPLDSIATIGSLGTMTIPKSSLVLDTANADRGLLSLKSLGTEKKQRVSHKKIVPEGAVIISRLRPYLRQVAYVPPGLHLRLKIDSILCSTEFYVMSAIAPGESIAFLVPWLLSTEVQRVLDDATTGGHHPRFDAELLKRLTIPRKIVEERKRISKEVEQLALTHLSTELDMLELIEKLS